MHSLLIAVAVASCLCAFAAPSQPGSAQTPTGFLNKTISVGGVAYPYVVYVPADYDPAKPWPTILFLHGKGECGQDGLKQVGQGIGRAILNDRSRWPFIVIFPQKPDAEKQWEAYDDVVMSTLSAVARDYTVDPDRTYLTGLSQGGHGTWTLAAAHPEMWAAIVPICGYGEPDLITPAVKSLPIWCFHGGADDLVKPEQSRRMIEALKARGASPKYTEYEGVNHNSWDSAYAEPELPGWLLAHPRAH